MYRGIEVRFQVFLISDRDGDVWLISHFGAFSLSTYCIGRWLGSRAELNVFATEYSFPWLFVVLPSANHVSDRVFTAETKTLCYMRVGRSQWPRSKAWTTFACLNAGVVGSNLTESMDFCVCVVFCVESGLAKVWSPSNESYWLCIGLRNWKIGQDPKGLKSHGERKKYASRGTPF
jgi:hypothetical protein